MALTTMAAAGTLTTGTMYYSSAARKKYDQAVRSTWRHTAGSSTNAQALQRELVRYATLAPSSHNTQCWKFRLAGTSIAIVPDFQRRCPVVDPDDHHLFVSLGCATENLIQAGVAHGLRATTTFDSEAHQIRVQLEPAATVRSPLFLAIPERQSTRAEYDGKPLTDEELALLERAGAGNGTRVMLLTNREVIEQALEYIIEGNTAQLDDAAFVRELKTWVRFGDAEAVNSRDGLFSRTTGNPSVPRWIGSPMFSRSLNAKTENDKYARQVRSSAGLAVFISEVNDREHWVETGRCLQRFALQSTALGIRTAHLNQPVEVAALRAQFSSFLGLGNHRPDLVVRFGRGPEMPRSLRRPVEAVLI